MSIPTCFSIVIASLTLLLTSCSYHQQTTPKPTNSVFFGTEPKAHTSIQKPLPALPPASLNSNPLTNGHSKPQPSFFNVSVHNIDAREFFMGLVMDSNENIVVHPEVTGTISLTLKNVTLADVINIVEKVYGYDCEKTQVGYIIYPAKLQTKIFKIDRLDLLREGRSNTLVTLGQNTRQNNQQNNNNQQGNNNNQQSNNYPQGNNPQGNNNNAQNSQMDSSWIRTTTRTDFWKELEDALHAIIAIDPQANVTMNRQSGVVVVRAKPKQLHEVESFINATQNQISRQVILEAKIMEVILDDSHQDGVNWRVLAQKGLDTAGVVTGFGQPDPAKFASIFTLGSNAGDFTAMVELLETQGKTNVLSSPRISTLNNQKAIIKVGRDEYFITEVSANAISTGNAITGINNTALPTAVMTSFFSGIALDVIPQIDDYENITLHIHPSITKVENLDKVFTIYGEQYSLPTALNTVRESDSIVKAQNGQIIVLGGLMQETEIENKEGITGLARLPFIGHLFRVDKGQTQKSELIILLKASIIADSSDWQNSLSPNKQRFEQLDSRPLWK